MRRLHIIQKLIAFGEDVGQIGDVNQGFSGLQLKYGAERIFDTGIRELTIMGQGIGLAMRGLRPIGEIQYIDYLLYGLETLSDDAATSSLQNFWSTDLPAYCPHQGSQVGRHLAQRIADGNGNKFLKGYVCLRAQKYGTGHWYV